MIQSACVFSGADQQALIAGVDEVGCGALAGPVYAASVILAPAAQALPIKDSKQLSPAARAKLATLIRASAIAWSVAHAEAAEIDRLNILQATLLAMQRAVAALAVRPAKVLVDGNHCPLLPMPAQAIVRGDAQVDAIAAASILAKVTRDGVMAALEQQHPGYGFARHKGYATAIHRAALHRLGPCPLHRRSFAPVRQALLAGHQ